MENLNLNKSICVSQVRQYRDWLHERNERELEVSKKAELPLEKMDSFSRTKKNMHLPTRNGIQEALKELNKEVVDEGSHTLSQPAEKSTADTHKRLRELAVSAETSAAKKAVEKRLKPPTKKRSG